MGGLNAYIAAALLGLVALALGAALIAERRRVRRLADRIEEFLVTGRAALSFSVREDGMAPLHNAAAELTNRVLLLQEKLAEECRRSSGLTADISHQLKTPLSALRLYCEMDAGTHLSAELEQIERMEKLIHALLRLERLSADGYAFSFSECDARAVVMSAWENLRPAYPGRRLTVEGDARLRCDGKWLREAYTNLLKNACEHTGEGGEIRVTLDATPALFSSAVEDDGGGVPPGVIARLFERFYRAPGSGKGGAGLGLAIVKEIVLRHHGSVFAENGDKGLRIILSIPRLENMV